MDLRSAPTTRHCGSGPLVGAAGPRSRPARSTVRSRSCCCSTGVGFASFLQCPACGEVEGLSPVQHRPHRASLSQPAALPLLRTRGADPDRVQELRSRRTADARGRHPAGGTLSRRAIPGGAAGANGSRHHEHQVVASSDSRDLRSGRCRHPARHPDDRQGTGFSQCDAGRRGGCRHRSSPAGLPSRRADVSAAGPGRGSSGAGARRAAESWCRPGTPSITRWSLPCDTTPRDSCGKNSAAPTRSSLSAGNRPGQPRFERTGRTPGERERRRRRGVVPATDRDSTAFPSRFSVRRRARWPGSRAGGDGMWC